MGGIYRRVINSGNLPLIYDSGNHNDDDEDFLGGIYRGVINRWS